ncbi:MFS transporter [Sphingobium sp. AN558]|uniref:MFS transporter n=1 Tax=Sphingobium sp. AN558 TaxID=3133442 RepID=UPI0030BD36FE
MSSEIEGSANHNPPPGEFQRNWKLIIACAAGCGFCMSAISQHSIGPFVKPLSEDMNWTRTQVQSALLLSQLAAATGVICAGILISRFPLRSIAIAGLTGTVIGLLLASQAKSLPFYYLAYVIAAFVGAGAGNIAWSRAITGSFDTHRGLALAIALSGTGISGIALPSILVWVISEYGWRTGYVALAAFPALISLPLVLFLFWPERSHGAGAKALAANSLSNKELFRSYRFWVLLMSVVCVYFAVTGVLSNLIPALTDGGFSAANAAIAQGSLAAAILAGRLLVGLLVDRFWAPAVGAIFLTPPAIGCLILMSDPSLIAAICAAAMIGMAAGAELDLLALLISRYFGLRPFARIFSYMSAMISVGGGVGPLLFSWIREFTGSYQASFTMTAGLFLLGGPLLMTLGRYPQLAENEAKAAAA